MVEGEDGEKGRRIEEEDGEKGRRIEEEEGREGSEEKNGRRGGRGEW